MPKTKNKTVHYCKECGYKAACGVVLQDMTCPKCKNKMSLIAGKVGSVDKYLAGLER